MKQIVSAVLLAIALFGCKSGPSGSPKNTVSSFINAARQGNLTEIKKYVSKSDVSMLEIGENLLAKFDPEASRGIKDKMMKEFEEKTKGARFEIKDEKIDGDNATVNVEFINNGKTETHPFNLVKEEGQWKISLLDAAMKNSTSSPEDIRQSMKNLNMDSLKNFLNEGMKNTNMDSLKESINEGMKHLDKRDQDSLKKAMEQGMKELEKLKEGLNQ